ncbi:MAG: MerR family transcriptional regulator, partial [Candidatus Melainabacteria bacterium]|nr:MerR family transcriptional regulator [Candidatus Melainabacteria bacterium]
MSQADMLSINAVAAKLGLSVHQLRRWELMFGLEIKRGRGQQRQYRSEDMSVLERIKELVEQGWPTSQIRPQLEAEGLVTPKLIGMPPPPGNPEVLSEALIGFRNFTERRFIEISKQIDELRQLLISITLKQELSGEPSSPWQPVQREFAPEPKTTPPQEISIGPDFSAGPPVEFTPPPPPPQRTSIIGAPPPPKETTFEVGPGSFSTPPSFTSAPPERRSIIGESAAPPPSPLTSAEPVMSEAEADALLEDEDLEEEVSEDEVIAAAPPPTAPAEVKDSLPNEGLSAEHDIDEDED